MSHEQQEADVPDLALVQQVQTRGDRRAFEVLVRRHQGMLRGYLARLCHGQQALADELAQEAFIQAWRGLPGFRGESAFKTWLVRIGLRLFLMQQRGVDALDQGRPRALNDDAGQCTEPGLRLDSEMEATEMGGRVSMASGALGGLSSEVAFALDLERAMTRHLSQAQRLAVATCLMADLSHAEAAQALGWPLGTLKTHLLRGLDRLRPALADWAPVGTSGPKGRSP